MTEISVLGKLFTPRWVISLPYRYIESITFTEDKTHKAREARATARAQSSL